jgi:GNAT superfamily N-acetyltransferase
MFTFKRPESLKIPQVYHKFKAKDKNSDEIVDYQVQDLLEEDFERALDLMVKFYLPDEPFAISMKVCANEEAVEDFRRFWRTILEERFTLACYKSNELVAVNMLVVCSRDDQTTNTSKFPSQEFRDIVEILGYSAQQFNVFEAYKVDHYLSGRGLCVNPSYRGRGIATEVLKARIPMMKALGLKVTSTHYNAIGSQMTAKKAGYKETFSIPYQELEQKFPNFKNATKSSKYLKRMNLEIEKS